MTEPTQEYFTSPEYTEGPDNIDPNASYFDEEHARRVARCCFHKPGRLIDWGAGSGLWIEAIEQDQRLHCFGVDWVKHDDTRPNVYAPLDLTRPVLAQDFPPELKNDLLEAGFDYALCQGVLLYVNPNKLEMALLNIWRSFKTAAYVFTPGGSQALFYDRHAVSFPDAGYLRVRCEEVGGRAAVLNLYNAPESQSGPAVLWVRADTVQQFHEYAWETRRRFREAYHAEGYRDEFTITL